MPFQLSAALFQPLPGAHCELSLFCYWRGPNIYLCGYDFTFHGNLTLVSWLSTNTEDEEDLDDSATEETKMADEKKKKFLENLEESDVEKEKSEKEEADEEGEEESSSSEEESDDEFDDSEDDVKKKDFMAKKVPPKRKAPAGRGRGRALKMPTALTGELSELSQEEEESGVRQRQ